MAARKILITGATGKQGGQVITQILANPPPFPFELLALTRNTESPAAKALTSKREISLIQGDLNHCLTIFEKAGGKGSVWGVFAVLLPSTGSKAPKDQEEKQGCALVDVAIANGVSHFVYTSVDRGGPRSDNDPTNVSHFISKHDIEQHLKEKAASTDMTWSILRPVAFFDNLTPGMMGQVFGAMWMNMGSKKLQLVSTPDIGRFAAMAFASPEKFRNKAISLAGDDLTQAEAAQIFLSTMGRSMPTSYGFFGTLIQWMIPELKIMFTWFCEFGYGADIAECKRLNPKMQDFAAWLKEDSKFK